MIEAPPFALLQPFKGTMHVYEHSAGDVSAICARLGVSGALACSVLLPLGKGDCIIYMPWVGPGGVIQAVRTQLDRHELAHCIYPGWHDGF